MVATFVRIRTLVLVAAVLLGGLAAVTAQAPREAAAGDHCTVIASGSKFVSNGYVYVRGIGSTGCSYNVSQSIGVYLYANGTLVRSTSSSIYGTSLGARTSAVVGYCGTRYQVATVHAVSGWTNTTTWSPGFYLC